MKSKLVSEETGQGMVEYTFILSMIGVLVVTAVQKSADQIQNLYQYNETQIGEMFKKILKCV